MAEATPKIETPVAKVVQARAPRPPRAFAHAGDEGAALAEVGALSAWSAVLERYRLLERRDQVGAVHGLLLEGEDGAPLRLVDLVQGQGALSIPIVFDDNVLVEPAMRVVAWGAWTLEDRGSNKDLEWVWKATRVELLDDEPGPPFSPGMQAREREAPEDLVPASRAPRQGGPISFVVLEKSERLGDGWLLADEPKGDAVARVFLPGEAESYGTQSSPSKAERWQLETGQRYWLEIGRFRPASGDSLPIFHASTVPFIYKPAGSESKTP